jgi:hypothetical protein
MPVTTIITALPSAPLVTDTAAQFDTKAFPFVDALADFVTETNAVGTEINSTATAVTASQTAAATSAANAAASEAASAGSANFAGVWASLVGAATAGITVYHSNQMWLLLNNLADITLSEPGVTADWLRVTQSARVIVTATGVTAEAGDHIHVTADGQTITLPATPAEGDVVSVSVGDFVGTTLGRNALNIMSTAADMTLDKANCTATLRYVDATRGWWIV